jgi:hypothetical protein
MPSPIFGLLARPGETAGQLALRMRHLLQTAQTTQTEAEPNPGAKMSLNTPQLLMPASGVTEAAVWALLSPQPVVLHALNAGPALAGPKAATLAYWRECTAIAYCVAHQSLHGLQCVAPATEKPPLPAAQARDLSQHDLAQDPLAGRYRSQPVQVRVEFALQAGSLATLEGEVGYRAGAALISGQNGERWPVERSEFDRRYHCVGPQAPGQDGLYRKAARPVLARQLMEAFFTCGGAQRDRMTGQPWDWLVQYAPGVHGVVAEALFADLYQPEGSV